MSYADDDILVQKCLAGDQAAWKELVNRYGRLVYSIPLKYGLSLLDADDVVQNVFSIVLRRLSSLRNKKTFAAWLITVTCRESWKLTKERRVTEELPESLGDDGMPPHEQVLLWERQHLVRQAIAQLGEPCQSLLTALFLDPDEPSYQEVAARQGIPLGSIGPTRARCIEKLEAILVNMGVDLG